MEKQVRSYLAEMIGTFIVVFGCAAVVCVNGIPAMTGSQPVAGVVLQPEPGLVGIALASGLALAVALAATLHLTEGYLNPAVTLMLWVFKRLDGFKTTALIGVQLLGAALAGGLVTLIFSPQEEVASAVHLGAPHVNFNAFGAAGVTGRTLLGGVAMEAVLTFVLTFVIFATLIDPRAPRWIGRLGRWLSPLWVGLAMVVVVLVGFNFTGGSANPARWFGTVIWEMSIPALQRQKPFADHLAFWVGPLLGALAAGGLYTSLILPAEKEATSGTTAAPTSRTPATAGSSGSRSRK